MPPVSLFCSYSHKDEEFRHALETHLKILERDGVLITWHDRKIQPGEHWDKEISQHLEEAGIIALLVSADFIASDYCHEKEMKRALQLHDAGIARIIPIAIRPALLGNAPFKALRPLPTNGKSIVEWSLRDAAWKDVAEGIRLAAEQIAGSRQRHIKRAPPSSVRLSLSFRALENEIHVVFGLQVYVGRSPKCEMSFPRASSRISNLHARLYYSPTESAFFIEDLRSRNGIHINETPIYQPTRITTGTQISLGQSLRFDVECTTHPEPPGLALIYRRSDGYELGRYILTPADRVGVGTGLHDLVRLPRVYDGRTVGVIQRLGTQLIYEPLDLDDMPGKTVLLLDYVEVNMLNLMAFVRLP